MYFLIEDFEDKKTAKMGIKALLGHGELSFASTKTGLSFRQSEIRISPDKRRKITLFCQGVQDAKRLSPSANGPHIVGAIFTAIVDEALIEVYEPCEARIDGTRGARPIVAQLHPAKGVPGGQGRAECR